MRSAKYKMGGRLLWHSLFWSRELRHVSWSGEKRSMLRRRASSKNSPFPRPKLDVYNHHLRIRVIGWSTNRILFQPCLIVKLNRVFGWQPEPYYNVTEVPASILYVLYIPATLHQNHIIFHIWGGQPSWYARLSETENHLNMGKTLQRREEWRKVKN